MLVHPILQECGTGWNSIGMRLQERDYNCVYVTTAEEMQPLFEPVWEFITCGYGIYSRHPRPYLKKN